MANLSAKIRENLEIASVINADITALSEEDQTLHGDIAQNATIQDRAQLELKGSTKKNGRLKGLGKYGGPPEDKKILCPA